MAAPSALGYGAPAASADGVVGPVVVGSGLLAAWPVLRGLRWIEAGAGTWLLLEPWVLGAPTIATVNAVIVGTLLIGLAPVGGEVERRFGGGWRAVWRG
jgi:SPW repeat